MALPADVALCLGVQIEGEWREGCEDCARRSEPPQSWGVIPPAIIIFECEYRIPRGDEC